jgi:hypothetical protein
MEATACAGVRSSGGAASAVSAAVVWRAYLIELAEGVVHLHHERHGGCIAIVVRQQQA